METKIFCALQNESLSFIFNTFPNVTLYVLGECSDQKFSPRFHESLSLSFISKTFPSVTLYVLGVHGDRNFVRAVSFSFILKTFPSVTLHVLGVYGDRNFVRASKCKFKFYLEYFSECHTLEYSDDNFSRALS